MTRYPLVVRNKVPLFYRGFMLIFVGMTLLMFHTAASGKSVPPDKWWPYILGTFLLVGISASWWALKQEAGVVRFLGPGSIEIERGMPLRRERHRVSRARLWIEDTQDSEGDPYFKLLLDAPGGKLVVQEGHDRQSLERMQERLEGAIAGSDHAGSNKLASP